jgi:hypothetical protein
LGGFLLGGNKMFFLIVYFIGMLLPLVAGVVIGNFAITLLTGIVLLLSSISFYIFDRSKHLAKSMGLELLIIVIPFCVSIIYLFTSISVWIFFGSLYV